MKWILSLLLLVVGVLPMQSVEKVKVEKGPSFRVDDVFSKQRLKAIDALMEAAVEREGIPSAVCYVSYRGKEVYFESFGYSNRADRKSLKTDDLFRMASQTKLVTTVAMMTLFEEGYFRLDDPIKQYLPEFSNPMVRVSGTVEAGDLVTRPAKGDITIRHLLSHSAGISYDPYDQEVQVISYADKTVSTEEAVRRIAKLPLKHDPGKGFTYGFSSDVLGRLAEVLTGKRLDALIQDRVLDPLEMKDTYFYVPKRNEKRLVPLYQKPSLSDPVSLAEDTTLQTYPLDSNPLYFGGGAGLTGTIEDYAHLCEMILNRGVYKNKRILARKTVDLMRSNQLYEIEGYFKFGFGLEIADYKTFAKTMRTPGSLRWGGYFGTEYVIDPKEQLVVLMYTNKVSWYKDDVWGDFLRAVYMSLY